MQQSLNDILFLSAVKDGLYHIDFIHGEIYSLYNQYGKRLHPKILGSQRLDGYTRLKCRTKDKKVFQILRSRAIMIAIMNDVISTNLTVDHINRNRSDDRLSNLRLVNRQLQNHNKKGYGMSKYKGVSWKADNNKWCAQIKINGVTKYLGLFDNEEDAATAYNEAAKKHYKKNAVINNIDSYRFDNRTVEQFTKDIKDRTLQERSLFLLWLDMIELKTGIRPSYNDTGCGRTGDLLKDKEVSMSPDFQVEGYGALEVKFAKRMLETHFHLKANQVKSYRDEGASILMVNGADSDVPLYTMLDTKALTSIINDCRVVNWIGFGYKAAYKIPINKFIWRPLK